MEKVNTREIVYDMLDAVIRQQRKAGDVASGALAVYAWMEKRDRAFMSRLFRGVLEYRQQLDQVIGAFSSVRLEKMKPAVRLLLEMGAYQILYMDHVPDSAACNETVKLAKKRAPRGLAGFVNGVLRQIARRKENIPVPSRETDPAGWLSYHCSLPLWLAQMWITERGFDTALQIGEAALKQQDICVRVRPFSQQDESGQQTDRTSLIRELKEAGMSVEPGRIFPEDALHIRGVDTLLQVPAFLDGRLTVQDESSMIPARIAGIGPADTVIDLCAAPGGKSAHAADLMYEACRDQFQQETDSGSYPEGRVFARDISEAKTARIMENMKRLHLGNVEVQEADALVMREQDRESADVVLADLPCSGLGVLGKKPDIKLHMDPEQIRSLAALQREMLTVAASYVKPGGTLVYSTCTVSKAENEDNLSWFLEHFPFETDPAARFLPSNAEYLQKEAGYIQVLPGECGADGFFAVRLKKKR